MCTVLINRRCAHCGRQSRKALKSTRSQHHSVLIR